MCWMEIEAFRGIPVSDKHVRDLKARQLRSKYFNKKYLFGPNSPASKDAQRQVRTGSQVCVCVCVCWGGGQSKMHRDR